MPVDQQELHPLYPSGILSLYETRGPQLNNADTIKEMMNLYNTSKFLVVLYINRSAKG